MKEAKELRSELKEAGYNARRVSVRYRHCTHDGELIVTIRDATVEKSELKGIVSKYERIDRCHVSGEILLGGNTYTEIRYSDEALEIRKNQVLPNINIALERLAGHPNDNTLEPAGDILIGTPNHDGFHHVWKGDRHIGSVYPDHQAADHIAQMVVTA